ncbi:protein SCAI [Iris pallida]|uniref:Protein SCAI n=1 Tax=Iris pallida TaxID=29817 RepID=A0AAX6F667_IRIPA|nr:protein SCAI [Iris pallida]
MADDEYRTFRSLVDSADRKFCKVQSLPPHSRGPHQSLLYRKAFGAYTRLWRFQLDRRRSLLAAGLRRREIGEVASRIGQLYYSQYVRTSEARFLVESYVFYEAILSRGYFEAEGEGPPADLGLRCKELRFHARFLVVAMLLNRKEVVRNLEERFRRLLEDCKVTFPGTNFKEWKLVLQETLRFLKADTAFTNSRPLRYNILFDSHPVSLPYITRFHARRELHLHDALLTSYHRNEVKLTELTLDTYRMLQCLEWEPSGSFYEMPKTEPSGNGAISDHSGGTSGLIDINLAADMIDSSLPPNPRKAILYHPSALHLISVLGTITEELSPDSVLLIYISASGKSDHSAAFQKDISETSFNSSKSNYASRNRYKWDSSLHQDPASDQSDSSDSSGSYLILGSRGSGGLNNLYPEDLIPFTRRPLFLVIDSDNSHAFKAAYMVQKEVKQLLCFFHPGECHQYLLLI